MLKLKVMSRCQITLLGIEYDDMLAMLRAPSALGEHRHCSGLKLWTQDGQDTKRTLQYCRNRGQYADNACPVVRMLVRLDENHVDSQRHTCEERCTAEYCNTPNAFCSVPPK